MANVDVEKIRNIVVLGHRGAGKTSLVEAMLFTSGDTTRIGKIEEGNTVSDFEPEETERQLSLSSAVAQCNWNGNILNLMDTPGFINFLEEARGMVRIADGALVIVSAISGVKPETIKVWGFASDNNVPRMVFINKMDKDNAEFDSAVESVEKSFGLDAIPLQVPIGKGPSFSGIVDIVNMKAFKYDDGKPSQIDIPADVAGVVEEYRKKLVEKVAESDDALLEKYLEGGELTDEEVIGGLKGGFLAGGFVPVLCGEAATAMGVHQLLENIFFCMPSPVEAASIMPIKGKDPKSGEEIERKPDAGEPLSAFVAKTIADPYAGRLSIFRVYSGKLKSDSSVYNVNTGAKERIGQVSYMQGKKQIPVQEVGPGDIAVVAKLKDTYTGDTLADETKPIEFSKVAYAEPIISYAIAPKSKGDEEKVSSGIQRILEEDPVLKFHRDEETKEMLLSGMGQVHIEVTIEKLKRKFGVDVDLKTPKIPYRETITGTASVQSKYKKQSGGRGQYGDCWIEVKPMPRGGGFEFVDNIVGGAIPRQYIPAVEKGIVEAMKEGIFAGYPMVDVSVRLFDGSYHAVDSSEMAFKIAGSMGIKKAAMEAKPVILEPIMKVEVMTPDEYLGNVIGDLNSKRGKVQGMDSQAGGNQKVQAQVPMSELLTYANQLHSLTAGQGLYTMEFSHYEEVPAHLAQKIIDERQKQKEGDEK